jgi:SAM-dependent methyltransferase
MNLGPSEPNGPIASRPINENALNELLGKMVGDLGAAASSALVLLGDRLGIYKALAQAGTVTSQQLAEHTGLAERYLREWLACQAASGYVQCNAEKETFWMTPEQVAVFADPESPAALTGGYYSLATLFIDEPLLEDAFRTGRGVSWGEHHPCLFCGTAKFFRPGYVANLVSQWIPSIPGLREKLAAGAKVADVGCGYGISTQIMAKAFPNSEFVGFDLHQGSIDHAAEHARIDGLTNVRFEVGIAKDFPGKDYDLVTVFDALHDMGDPVGAATHIRKSLRPEGRWLLVEPMAGDRLADNLNPVGRVYYAFSTFICVPASLSQEVGLALGAQAGEARLREVATRAGFSQFRRAAETPFNLVFEGRP